MVRLLGRKGLKEKFLVVLDRSFDNIPDAREVISGDVIPTENLIVVDRKTLKKVG